MDFDDPTTLDFSGVTTIVLVSAGYAEDDVVIRRHNAVIEAAEMHNVEHVIYTSLTGAGDHLAFALAHRWTERRLQQSRLSWTILRNGLYAELYGGFLQPTNNVITTSFGSGALAAVVRSDLAEVAGLVAMHPHEHRLKTYELVGLEAITAADVAKRLDVSYEPLSLAEQRELIAQMTLLPFQPAMMMSIITSVAHGFLSATHSDLPELLNRAPLSAIETVVATAQGSG